MIRKIIPFSKLDGSLKQEVLRKLSENPQKIEVSFKEQKLQAVFLNKVDIQYLIPLDLANEEVNNFDEDDNFETIDDLDISEL
ncbi:MAG: hypothetical protein ISP73_04105 [Flavobacteriales bacterium]|nr:hypothetical protein [Flavobacteriales bacterium]